MSFQVRHVENGEGEAVIFLHGVGGDSDSWAPPAPRRSMPKASGVPGRSTRGMGHCHVN